MSPRPRPLHAESDEAPPPTPLELVKALALSSESAPLRALAAELMVLHSMLSPATAMDLEAQIDRAVAMVLSREGRDDKGQYLVGPREIDVAVKWFAIKHKKAGPDDGMGDALGRGGAE
jgi:hypothetical protein